jgi:hypothetical protein
MENPLNMQITEELTRENFLLWRNQLLPQIRGTSLFGYLDGSTPKPEKSISSTYKDGKVVDLPNPVHAAWAIQDQQVLAYLLTSVSKEVLTQMVSAETTQAAWTALTNMFSSQSCSCINNLRISLSNTEKGNQTVAVYFAKMRSLADELAAAGRPL